MSAEGDRAVVNGITAELETMAEKLEKLMPAVRRARDALSGIAPDAARHRGFEGSVDQFDAAAAEGFGFARVETARLRLLAALKAPMDDIPRT